MTVSAGDGTTTWAIAPLQILVSWGDPSGAMGEELRCRWHVMIPPYDWKQVELLNYSTGLHWWAYIDANGIYEEYSSQMTVSCSPLKPDHPTRASGWMTH